MMVSSEYLVHWTRKPGLTPLVRPGDAALRYIDFGMIHLARATCFDVPAGDKETALVLLGGEVAIEGLGKPCMIGPRRSVFEDNPWTVMLPARCGCRIVATADAEIALCQAPSSRGGEPCVIGPESVKQMDIGRDHWQRRARIMVDEQVPADLLFIGEALVTDGNWASYPSHRHEKDALPDEVEMEEIYYFRFDRPQGFGIQKVYTDDRAIDQTLSVGDHDTVLIPRGYHPVVAAPGYAMYYLWIMAGRNRRFISRLDPDHAWVAK